MKKLYIIIAATLSINAASAQSRNAVYNDRDHSQTTQTVNNGYRNDRGGNQGYYNNQRNDQYDRGVAYNKMNGQYDQRNNGYGYDRSGNGYDRQRKMNDVRVPQQKKSSFGTGLVVGGLAALLIGALVSH